MPRAAAVPEMDPAYPAFNKAFRSHASETRTHGEKLKKTAHQRIDALKKAQKGPNGDHLHVDHLLQRVLYPAHDKRTESPEYKKVHHDLVHNKDLPCLVCGVRASTLTDPEHNPYGATALETHHHIIEWALANAIKPVKFNRSLRPNLMHRSDNPIYKRDMTAEEIRDWVDHSPDNLWVLCDVHHRHKFVGIHAITYPIWCPQDLTAYDIADVANAPADAKPAKKKPGQTNGRSAGKRPASKGSRSPRSRAETR
jgi:hypothetical protein